MEVFLLMVILQQYPGRSETGASQRVQIIPASLEMFRRTHQEPWKMSTPFDSLISLLEISSKKIILNTEKVLCIEAHCRTT